MGRYISYLALVAPKYWEALKQSEALVLNKIGYCESSFASLKTKPFI